MPDLDEKVDRQPGKPRVITSTITYYPGDEKTLSDGEMIAGIRDHWDPNGNGFYRPDPDAPGQFMRVYITGYDRDDTNPAAKKRTMVTEEIL